MKESKINLMIRIVIIVMKQVISIRPNLVNILMMMVMMEMMAELTTNFLMFLKIIPILYWTHQIFRNYQKKNDLHGF